MKNKKTMAAKADRYKLYEQSVQCPDADFDFAEQVFRSHNGRKPKSLREDFCASALIASSWVKRDRSNTAIGIDTDAAVLDWGRQHHVAALTPSQRRRITLLQADVMAAAATSVDMIMAMNFSYWIFMDRASMSKYFIRAGKGLNADGLLILDAFGGSSACTEMKERTKFKKFTYVWEQEEYDPATARMRCNIHFRFPDKSWLKNAFTYEWRLWTLPELLELLHESGFEADVYWEGEDENGEGNGEYELLQGKASADEAWICYIVARRR